MLFLRLVLLIVGTGARIYEKCELARELTQLGVQREHLATWVCIAYHESRMDTSAHNPGSGDHGLLQISEIYWCGSGKVCGLPCSALRDDDIEDDVQCAFKIHEEHTKINGDGFLAWVVYPQHCKHNTKKYLIDCDDAVKTTTERPLQKLRSFSILNNTDFEYNTKIDYLQPPYLTVNSIYRQENSRKLKTPQTDSKLHWRKFTNIDDLKIPNLKNDKNANDFTTTTTMRNVESKPETTSPKIELLKGSKVTKAQKESTHKEVSTKLNEKKTTEVTSVSPFHFKNQVTTESSVFDLYFNTNRPVLSTYSFAPFSGKRFKVNIFSEGSTTSRFNTNTERSFLKPHKNNAGITRNHIKRQSFV